MVRRLIVTATNAIGIWQLLGADEEIFADVENFSGIGFVSRPSPSGRPEVVIVNIGGEPNHPVIVATRDKSIQVELEEDETAIFNSSTWVKITKDGEVLISEKNGSTEPLVKKSEFAAHTHIVSLPVVSDAVNGPTATPPGITGTTVLKAN